MSSLTFKPSDEARLDTDNPSNSDDEIKIHGYTFATSNYLKDSLKESIRKTEIWTLTDRLNSLD